MLLNVVERKWWYFAFSALLIVPGLVFIAIGGLKPGIEFEGGSLLDVRFERAPLVVEVQELMAANGHPEAVVQGAEGERVLVRSRHLSAEEIAELQRRFETRFVGSLRDVTSNSISSSFSTELLRNAVIAIAVASVLIVLLVATAFYQFGWYAFVYGICAIVALLHDAAFVLGLWAILGYVFNVEVDSLFVTAVLTVIGFSVHDTIVVFDRIRENLRLNPGEPVNPVINFSIMQTLARSVNTSLTTLLVLLALFALGGYSIRNFVLALLVGIVSGTYSSIFNASQLVSLWYERRDAWRRRRVERATA